MSIADLVEPLRVLGDPVRLRVLRLLGRERLNVSELTRILGIAQSAVSRHVGLLREAGLVHEERRGGWTWLAPAESPPAPFAALWAGVAAGLAREGDGEGDDARLAVVLRDRAERGEGSGEASGRHEPGRSWSAWARALLHLLPPLRVAHLGSGDGALTLEVARFAGAVTGVDPDPSAASAAREEARRTGRRNASFVVAPLEGTSLPEASFDLVLLAQVLHRVEDPAAVVREAGRLCAPGGRALVLDLLPHGEAWVRERLGHRRLGVPGPEVEAWLAAAGLGDVRSEEAARRRGDPFPILVASARRPEATR